MVRLKSTKSAGFRSETTRTLSAVHQERGSGSPWTGRRAEAESGSRRVTGSPSAREHVGDDGRVGGAVGRGAHSGHGGGEGAVPGDGTVGEPGMELADGDPEPAERGEALDPRAVGGGRLGGGRWRAQETEGERYRREARK